MVSLVEAYQGGAIRDFERILRTHRAAIMGDTFISQYMQDLLANIRTQAGAAAAAQGVGGAGLVSGGARRAWAGLSVRMTP